MKFGYFCNTTNWTHKPYDKLLDETGTYYPNQIGVYLNIPIGPGITSQKRIIYSTEGKSMSKEEIDITKKIWWSVHKEDHEMCERLQEGRSSPASNDGGLLSFYFL